MKRNFRNQRSATVRVPASTSNLGPGFDCLGVALRLYNEVTVSSDPRGTNSRMENEAATKFFTHTGIEPFRFSSSIRGDVPEARGLGSSVTVRLGILCGLNSIAGAPVTTEELYQLCAALEGHPDNAAPSTFGGFTIARSDCVQRFAVSARLKFVLLIPGHEVNTKEARAVLPMRIDRVSAVSSCSNACAVTAAFAAQEYEQLRGAFADSLHQPFREKLNPRMSEIINAGKEAGALGGFLSGSGSTIACVTLRKAREVGAAMRSATESRAARVVITSADNHGMRLVPSR